MDRRWCVEMSASQRCWYRVLRALSFLGGYVLAANAWRSARDRSAPPAGTGLVTFGEAQRAQDAVDEEGAVEALPVGLSLLDRLTIVGECCRRGEDMVDLVVVEHGEEVERRFAPLSGVVQWYFWYVFLHGNELVGVLQEGINHCDALKEQAASATILDVAQMRLVGVAALSCAEPPRLSSRYVHLGPFRAASAFPRFSTSSSQG